MPEETVQEKKREFKWVTVLWYIHLHVLGMYGLFLLLTEAKWLTVIFALFIMGLSCLGITAGAHRLWAHEAYVASGPLKLFLMLAHTLAGVGTIYDWVMLHRIHHNFYGTEKDPYNHNKGFLYSHIFTNLMNDIPDREKIQKDIDMRVIEVDGYVWIQKSFYWILFPILGLLLPVNAPAEYWGESIMNSVFILGFLRLVVACQLSWMVNSAMLIWGLKPGDKFPVDDNSIFLLNKSYWPNYHYLLPWDWKTGEYGGYDRGFATFFINTWRSMGLVSSAKTITSEAIRDVLGLAAEKKASPSEYWDELKKISEEEAKKAELRYHH
ncbi:acyl-CoA Delta(11) desaturase [Belonocnema kinseyi]|uniref:acyl-CoA Delta(11) desaturase n=1 Tax=Belonocnema kinseyi TaxID=2817044 RepID=UPI00143DC279|nr:acyl-CoA Delta(11) desaturase [Belonocnema kinseyi]